MSTTFGGTIKLDGEKEYREALSQISKELKVAGSEMKIVTAEFGKNNKSVEALTAKNKVLSAEIEKQEEKVGLLNGAYKESVEKYGENSKQALNYKQQLNNATAQLITMTKEVEENEKAIKEAGDTSTSAAKDVDKLGDELKSAGKKADDGQSKLKKFGKTALSVGKEIASSVGGIMKGIGGLAAGTVTAFLATAEGTSETQTELAKLEQSYSSAGLTYDDATDALYSLQGVLGDTGKATEAANLIAKTSKNSDDLKKNLRVLTGVYAEYGDSIPIEGLAEGISATAQMGSVQGVLADALEWQGINLDEFNAKLENMSSTEERSAYIQKTLTKLYGESADSYRKNNQALIESNEAQMRMQNNLAEYGKIARPIMNEVKNLTSNLLMNMRPAVELMGEGFIGALNGSGEASAKFSEGITSLFSTVVGKIGEFVPMITNMANIMIPALVTGISDSLPDIIPSVVGLVTTITSTLLENLPLIISCGLDVILAVAIGITDSLPELIPTIVETVLTIVNVLLDNIDLLIEAAIQIVVALAEGIIGALPELIARLPEIIIKIQSTLIQLAPQLISASIRIIAVLAEGLIKAIPDLVSKIPQIIRGIKNALSQGWNDMKNIGVNFLKGIWQGIVDTTSWLYNKIKSIGSVIIGAMEDGLDIHSPSRKARDRVGKMTAKGVGVGYVDELKNVKALIKDATQKVLPENLDMGVNTSVHTSVTNYAAQAIASAVITALRQFKGQVILSDREVGEFVIDTVTREVFV